MKVFVINPGATSTKIAIFDEAEQIYKKNIDHPRAELGHFTRIIDQAEYRLQAVLDAVEESGNPLSSFDAVCGRGGLFRPIPGGTYLVNEAVIQDVERAPYGEHAANLGAYLAHKIGEMAAIPAFFVDPVCVDELSDVAHYTGFAPMRRLCQFHALNQKSVARKAARQLGKTYETARLIVCHLGGGVSIGAHLHGRVVDVNNPRDDGTMSLDRGGSLPVHQIVDYCFSGITQKEVRRMLDQCSGMYSYVGTTDFREICRKVAEGDAKFTEAYSALVYQISQNIGSMAAVLQFNVDGIVYTGGMAYNKKFCDDITAYVGKVAPIISLPGEEEMRSLAEGALRVLHGEQSAKEY